MYYLIWSSMKINGSWVRVWSTWYVMKWGDIIEVRRLLIFKVYHKAEVFLTIPGTMFREHYRYYVYSDSDWEHLTVPLAMPTCNAQWRGAIRGNLSKCQKTNARSAILCSYVEFVYFFKYLFQFFTFCISRNASVRAYQMLFKGWTWIGTIIFC